MDSQRVWMAFAVLAAPGLLATAGCCRTQKCPTTPRARAGAADVQPTSVDPFVAARLQRLQSVDVDALWVRRKYNPKTKKIDFSGGTTRVRLFVGPNSRGVSSVGVSEQFPGGAGSSWKASVWIAARNASLFLGREIVDFRFQADGEGFIDGPSAGGLFTAGFMAAILGEKVRPEATMTGTVNPDGTVGPVGGLEHKFLGALRKGKKVLGYPEGNKLVKGKGGRVVNLETLAAEHGAKAVPVRDVFEAYELLTGKKFPGRNKATKADMGFDKALTVTLLGRAAAWRRQHAQLISNTGGRVTDTLSKRLYSARLDPAKIYHEVSLSAATNKAAGASYYSAVRSATWAYTADKFTEVVYLWRQWLELLKKKEATARVAWSMLFRKRFQARLALIQEAACLRKKWKTPACKTLKVKLTRERAAAKKQAAAEKRRKQAEAKKKQQEQRLQKTCEKRAWKTFACKRLKAAGDRAAKAAAAQKAAKAAEARKMPPEPPKDFQKLLIERAKAMDAKTKNIDKVKADLAMVKPTTVDQALALISGYAELVQGAAFSMVGKSRLAMLQSYGRFRRYMISQWARRRSLYQTTNYVDETVKFAGIAFGKANLARELSSLYSPGSRSVSVSEKRMKSIANQLFAAAKANLDYINSLLPSGFRGYFVRRWLSSRSPEFVIARIGMTRAGTLVFKFREAGEKGKHIELGTGYAALGAAVASFMASSKLIAKIFTLGVKHKTGDKVQHVRRAIDLTNALHRARVFALEASYRAKKSIGVVPTFSRIQFQTADVYRKESLSGQVKALELYWRAGLYARLAEMLVRQ
ncbi:MAG: S16 family serine protease [bacterium]